MPVERCSKCGKVISTRFPIHECKPLTKPEFEALLTKAAQPLPKPEQPPDQEKEQTSGQPTSGDCNENHTR